MDINKNKLEVSGLSSDSEDDVYDLFSRYGKITDMTFITDNIAIIKFEDYRDAEDAFRELDGRTLDRNTIIIKYYEEQDQNPKNNKLVKLGIETWKKIFQQFIPNTNTPNVIHFLNPPERVIENGERIGFDVIFTYKKLSVVNVMKLLDDKTIYEMKMMLNKSNYFGYYNLNVLSINLTTVNMDFINETTKVYLKIVCEFIQPDDYYGTIGAYRITWENICVKKQFDKKGLMELAKDLNLEYNSNDDLCKIIGETVNNLSFHDFSEY
jgi:RNA recognition motif-containing protein